jgi:hypothetical protein
MFFLAFVSVLLSPHISDVSAPIGQAALLVKGRCLGSLVKEGMTPSR